MAQKAGAWTKLLLSWRHAGFSVHNRVRVDPLVCPSCGGEMKVVAFITEHEVVDRILRHLKRRGETERVRGPPGTELAAMS